MSLNGYVDEPCVLRTELEMGAKCRKIGAHERKVVTAEGDSSDTLDVLSCYLLELILLRRLS